MPNNKIAIISDVHSNYEALTSVLSHAEAQGASEVWFLGDAVGYGPDPHRCLKLLQETVTQPGTWIIGNHDEALRYPPNGAERPHTDKYSILSPNLQAQINPIARFIPPGSDTFKAFSLNYTILDRYPDRRNYLLSRPATSQPEEKFFLAHGGIRSGSPTTTYTRDRIDAQEEFYQYLYCITDDTIKKLEIENQPQDLLQLLLSIKNREFQGENQFYEFLKTLYGEKLNREYQNAVIKYAFAGYKRRYPNVEPHIFLYGHTHKPAGFTLKSNIDSDNREFSEQDLKAGVSIPILGEEVWYLNPGSVGQPRDGDPRASYLIIDNIAGTFQLHRVVYNIHSVQKQMENFEMPENLIKRLSVGR